MSLSVEEAAALLSANPDYRVLRRLNPELVGGPPLIQGAIKRAAIVDTETTGLDPKTDQVIELGIVVFEYATDTGTVGSVVGHLQALEDPGRPIPPETTAIHHITDSMVAGTKLDEPAIVETMKGVGLVIAHNATFDRPFLEARLSSFKHLPWACSIRDIDWKSVGYASSALEHLAYRSGFFFEGHRAEVDCRALLQVLAMPFGTDGHSAFRRLLETARQPTIRIYATNAPFEVKNLLKGRGYHWHSDQRVWAVEVRTGDKESELAWLKESVYDNQDAEVQLELLSAMTRYSGRGGDRSTLTI